MGTNQFKRELEKLGEYAESIPENTELCKYIQQINELIYSDGEKKVFETEYKPIVDKLEKTEKPFLSVIVRTRGNRDIGLREALLCLRAQTNQDFEILLIAHKADKEGKECVSRVVEEQPETFREKIRYVELDRGTRTTPINVGFANARGRYVAIFDDDDLLFDNWVEKFYEAAKINDGKILHAYVLAQRWKVFENSISGENDTKKYMAVEAPTTQFCQKFNLLTQLTVNKCPLMSLAFPAYLFHELGMVFNEELDVTEDWEYFMRVVTITGIADIEEPTSIYRLWTNAENSATLHDQKIWDDTYARIQKNRNSRALLIPEGNIEQIVRIVQNGTQQTINIQNGYPQLYGLLYYGSDNQFTDERMLVGDDCGKFPEFDMKFSVPVGDTGISNFRFDPCQYGGIILQALKITMIMVDGTEVEVALEKCQHNGMECELGIYFLKFDPQILWKYEGAKQVDFVRVAGRINMEVPAEIVEAAISYFAEKNKGRLRRFLKK